MADSKPKFRRGAEEAAHASKGTNWAKTHFFGIEDKERVVVRFITDANPDPNTGEGGWVTVDQHNAIPTKPKPEGYEGSWPEKMGAVCRKDEAFDFGECYICDFLVDGKKIKNPTGRMWALACLREEVQENGQIVGYKDMTRMVAQVGDDGKPTGEEKPEKAIVVVNLGFKNFFSALKGFSGVYGTVLDRDYVIIRNGTGTDTTYNVVPLDPIQMSDGQRFDLRNPEHAKRYETDLVLEDLIAERASDDFYARFFDPRYTPSKDKEGTIEKTGASPEAAKPDNDVDEDKLKALASRVKGYGDNGGEAKTEPEAAPAAEDNGKTVAAATGARNFDE